MIDNLVTGEFYKFTFNKENWPNLSMCVVLSGITNKEAMGNITDYDMKEELFLNYNLGLNTYISLSNCDLLIVNEIKNLETQEVDTENRILIPKLMIDFENSEKLIKVSKLNFSILGIKRYFQTEKEVNDFISDSRYALKSYLNNLNNFAGEELSIEGTSSFVLMEESYILKEEKLRLERLLGFQKANTQNKIIQEQTLRNAVITKEKYESKFQELSIQEEALKKAQENNNAYYNEIMLYSEANDNFSKLMRETNRLMKEKGVELGIEVPDYDQFIEEAKNNIAKPTDLNLTPADSIEVNKNGTSDIVFQTNAETIKVVSDDERKATAEVNMEERKIIVSGIEIGTCHLTISAQAEDFDLTEKKITVLIN